jgi:hypothetical protein
VTFMVVLYLRFIFTLVIRLLERANETGGLCALCERDGEKVLVRKLEGRRIHRR